MRKLSLLVCSLLALLTLVGCAKPPEDSLRALQKAKQAINNGQCHGEFKIVAEELIAELELQQSHFFKSYRKTAELSTRILAMELPEQTLPGVHEVSPSYKFCPYCGRQLP